MTLHRPSVDRHLGDQLKIKVSDHVVCAWTWGLTLSRNPDSGGALFTLTLRKSHPAWELFEEFISHLPGMACTYISETDWYRRMDEKHSADVADLEISEEMAKTLYFPLWQLAKQHEDDDE